MFFRNTHIPPLHRERRSGIATLEFAFVLPVMLIFILGTIEVCQRIFLRQSALLVAYEGARLSVRSTSSSQNVISRCNEMLKQRRISGGGVELSPSNILELNPGDRIRVRVTVPWDKNTPTRFVLKDQGILTVDVYMLRE
jgi:hypothetical protein